ALLSGTILVPKLPREREVELRLADPASVTSVDVSWADQGEPVHGGSWRFDPGRAPLAVVSKISLPNGRYDLDVTVGRRDAPSATAHRLIDLDSTDHVTVRLP